MKHQIWNSVVLALGVLVLAVGGPWLVREMRTLPHPTALRARAHQRIVTLEIGGMKCSGCAAAIRTQLAAVSGVSTVEVRVAQQRAYVVCERSVPDTALTAAVGRAGPGFLAGVAH